MYNKTRVLFVKNIQFRKKNLLSTHKCEKGWIFSLWRFFLPYLGKNSLKIHIYFYFETFIKSFLSILVHRNNNILLIDSNIWQQDV